MTEGQRAILIAIFGVGLILSIAMFMADNFGKSGGGASDCIRYSSRTDDLC